jgi:hypothetical protein
MESRSRVLLDLHPKDLPVVPMAIRVGAYQAHWLRDPEEWQPSTSATAHEQWADLLRHLFLRYPVPRCLEQAWHTRGSLEHFDRDCYVAAAAGQSMRAVTGFPSSVSHRTLHLALHECDEPSLAQAIWRAQLKLLGAREELERQVMTSRVIRELTHHAFWVRLVESFARSVDDGADFGFVADAISMATAQYGAKRGDQLLRLPLNELRRWGRKWWLEVLKNNHDVFTPEQLWAHSTREELRQLGLLTWMPMLGNQWSVARFEDGLPAEEWTMVELCSQAALMEEGRIMRHCVADYGGACRAGRNAIFSLRRRQLLTQPVAEDREVTLQVAVQRRQVVQVRKYHNIEPNAEDMVMVRDWARTSGLLMNC